MAEMLLINPRRRRASSTKKRRVTRARRRNPVTTVMAPTSRRRRNPVAAMKKRVMRRRRNPIGMTTGMMKMIQDAFVGGAGSIAVDLVQGQVNKFLPATLQTRPGTVGIGDGVKAVLTVVLGRALSRPTRGLSTKMAMGALTVQSAGIMKTLLGPTLGANLGFYSPAMITDMTNRVGPIRNNVGAYLPPNQTALLSAYTRPGVTPLLSAAKGMTARAREGYAFK
jgi:hypothetical protein